MISNHGQKWFALEITVAADAAEAIEFGLNELDALGTAINDFERKQVEAIKVTGYFNQILGEADVRARLNDALRIYGFRRNAVKDLEWCVVPDQDWLHEWKKHWKATETGRFIIAPPWEKVERPDKIVISIEPNMAFGTGTHETTRLCLRAIEDHYRTGMSFLDVGTGTGILAIAASRMAAIGIDQNTGKELGKDGQNMPESAIGASAVGAMPFTALISACDTDEVSVRIAWENAVLNGVGGIEFYVGSVSEETPQFDFVCANLTADVIVPLLPLLVGKAGKVLVLSGILVGQEVIVEAELRALGAEDLFVCTEGEWIGITVWPRAA